MTKARGRVPAIVAFSFLIIAFILFLAGGILIAKNYGEIYKRGSNVIDTLVTLIKNGNKNAINATDLNTIADAFKENFEEFRKALLAFWEYMITLKTAWILIASGLVLGTVAWLLSFVVLFITNGKRSTVAKVLLLISLPLPLLMPLVWMIGLIFAMTVTKWNAAIKANGQIEFA
ncbi:hypothetical protein FJO69_01390 [[Mycoplasma] falconis]|uniref:Uncharacterized protein n=1 Tax=[Mycoplasma] falconis TaxID=92403 RepID=A0A501XAB0_9BACT|nr:hypothetical protein [[Mycoplasma] falconis]TPE57568.1 hypothetical protein FJO69_01390 [[Mycoplasma] falconis]